MSSKDFHSSLKEIMTKTNKTKLFLNKLKHHRNLSTSVPSIPLNISLKKIYSRKDKEKEKEACDKSCCLKPSLFNISSNSLEQISSYGTNNKAKENGDTKEKEKEKEGKKKLFILKEKERIIAKNDENETQIVYKTKEAEKRASKTKKVKNKSQKILPSLRKKIKEKENTADKSKEESNDETIQRKRYDNSTNIDTVNEIDVILMRDAIPTFISCKSGKVGSVALHELQTVTRRFGGKYAIKVLIMATPCDNPGSGAGFFRKRAKDMHIWVIDDVYSMSDEALRQKLIKIQGVTF